MVKMQQNYSLFEKLVERSFGVVAPAEKMLMFL
jgi:hypothetical protein